MSELDIAVLSFGLCFGGVCLLAGWSFIKAQEKEAAVSIDRTTGGKNNA